MKFAQVKEVTTLVSVNVEGTINDPENQVIYGTDMFTKEQEEMFEGLYEMEVQRLVRVGTIKRKQCNRPEYVYKLFSVYKCVLVLMMIQKYRNRSLTIEQIRAS